MMKKFQALQDNENVFPTLPDETDCSFLPELTQSSVQPLLENHIINEFLLAYDQHREELRLGQHGKTTQLWISYVDYIWLVLFL